MDADLVAERVLDRYLVAKGKGLDLRPEYEKALKALEAGDIEPIKAFGTKVQLIIAPDGRNGAEWFNALGTAKRNALIGLHRDIEVAKAYLNDAVTSNPHMLAYRANKVKDWAKAIRTLELASVLTDADREVKHGPFVVVPVPGVTKKQLDATLEALDAAADKIRPKFPQVLYGKIFLATHLARNTAAQYMHSSDTMSLDVTATKRFNDVYSLCHEFGHRFETKFLDKDLHKRFWALSTRKVYEVIKFDAELRDKVADEVVFLAKQQAIGKPLPKYSPELLAWLKSPDGPTDIRRHVTDFLNYTIDAAKLHAEAKGTKDVDVMTNKLVHGPLAVTPYGASNPTENFAEAFAHFVLGMDLAPEFAEILNEAK
jgi:hypothetical protein